MYAKDKDKELCLQEPNQPFVSVICWFIYQIIGFIH